MGSQRGGGRGKIEDGEMGYEKSSPVWFHRSSVPLGPLPKSASVVILKKALTDRPLVCNEFFQNIQEGQKMFDTQMKLKANKEHSLTHVLHNSHP